MPQRDLISLRAPEARLRFGRESGTAVPRLDDGLIQETQMFANVLDLIIGPAACCDHPNRHARRDWGHRYGS